jgi:hypothetical protein
MNDSEIKIFYDEKMPNVQINTLNTLQAPKGEAFKLDKMRNKHVRIDDQQLTSVYQKNNLENSQPVHPVRFFDQQIPMLEKEFNKTHKEQIIPVGGEIQRGKVQQQMTEANQFTKSPFAQPITQDDDGIVKSLEGPIQSFVNKTSQLLPTAAVITAMLGGAAPEISIPVAGSLLAATVVAPIGANLALKAGEFVESEIKNVFG